MATNKIESLDPALIRPGRIDRKIEFPAPDQKTRRHIFQIHTTKMNLSEDVNLEEFIMMKDELSGADIKAMCTEAGLLALRERRMKVSQAEFRKARDYVLYKKNTGASCTVSWRKLLPSTTSPFCACCYSQALQRVSTSDSCSRFRELIFIAGGFDGLLVIPLTSLLSRKPHTCASFVIV